MSSSKRVLPLLDPKKGKGENFNELNFNLLIILLSSSSSSSFCLIFIFHDFIFTESTPTRSSAFPLRETTATGFGDE
ncbi:hypothetical protein BDV29DRAFT_177620 [Aspergillus leporis]|uniref:Transmembrane protein n=1 Tax=Aspergillus leporis TaxID=41062 RepID=A0A5N5WX48_9EURO|nr:hypothetical protein BDV29DRAFT_177620 [Aspergillus leporis]